MLCVCVAACGGKPREKPPLAVSWQANHFTVTGLEGVTGEVTGKDDKVVVNLSDPHFEVQAVRVGERGIGNPSGVHEVPAPVELLGEVPLAASGTVTVKVPIAIVIKDQPLLGSVDVPLRVAQPSAILDGTRGVAFLGEPPAAAKSVLVLGANRIVGPAKLLRDLTALAKVERGDSTAMRCTFYTPSSTTTPVAISVAMFDAKVTLVDRRTGAVAKTGTVPHRTACPDGISVEKNSLHAELDADPAAIDAWIAAN